MPPAEPGKHPPTPLRHGLPAFASASARRAHRHQRWHPPCPQKTPKPRRTFSHPCRCPASPSVRKRSGGLMPSSLAAAVTLPPWVFRTRSSMSRPSAFLASFRVTSRAEAAFSSVSPTWSPPPLGLPCWPHCLSGCASGCVAKRLYYFCHYKSTTAHINKITGICSGQRFFIRRLHRLVHLSF